MCRLAALLACVLLAPHFTGAAAAQERRVVLVVGANA